MSRSSAVSPRRLAIDTLRVAPVLAAVVVLALIVGLAAVGGQLAYGSAWGFPLADGVWLFDVAMLALELAAFLLAVALGTPGCEIGVWRELIARARGQPLSRTDGLACVVGLQLIDEWESGRLRRRDSHAR